MNRALAALTCATFVVVLLGLPAASWPLPAAGLALTYTVLATVGFAWVSRRGRLVAAGYVVVQLVLGYALFAATNAGIGATLLLLILVVQSVILLPLPAAAVVTALVPLVHVGMSFADGLRNTTPPWWSRRRRQLAGSHKSGSQRRVEEPPQKRLSVRAAW